MKCPVDGTVLSISERRGIEIDYCPQCRGVWLDRGELDKLIDRAAEEVPEPPPYVAPRDPREHRDYREPERPAPYGGYPDPRYRKKKKSFLGEVFDFD